MDVNITNPLLEFLPNTVENIRKIYNLDGGRIEQSVDILEDWVKKQEHFLNKNFSRSYLERTIITCKGSVEKAKKQIDKLCSFKTFLPKFFISDEVKSICNTVAEAGYVLVTPKMTKAYERVFIVKFLNEKKLTSSVYLNFYRYCLVVCEYLKAHDYINGFIIIYDLRDVNLTDLMATLNILEFHQFIKILVEGFGARLKGIHVITPSKAIDMVVNTLKPFLPKKIANRIHIHQVIEELHQLMDVKDLLPVEYGGTARSFKDMQEEWTKIVGAEEHEKYLAITKTWGIDESLRPREQFNEHYMGIPGSFRTLTVD